MNKLIFHLILGFLMIFSFIISNAQPSMSWSRIYSPSIFDDYGESICSSGNGFYYVGGQATDANFHSSGYILKINEFGDSVWGMYIPEVGVIQSIIGTPDGGCIFAGESAGPIFMKIDANGYRQWVHSYAQDVTFIYDIKLTSDGKYIACGMRNAQQDGIILKFDINGMLDWLKLYPAGVLKNLTSLEELSNGGYIVAGGIKEFSGDLTHVLIMRISNLGDTIWQKKFLIFNNPAYGGFIKKINNQFFIAGRTSDTSNGPYSERNYFIKIDTSGNLQFIKIFPFYKRDYYLTAQCININRFIFSSFAFSLNNNDTSYNRVFISDTLGNIVFEKHFFSELQLNQFNSILKASNGDLLGAGNTIVNHYDFLVCRFDTTLQGPPIGIKMISSITPSLFHLYQNYPNPFNSSTNLKFDIAQFGRVQIFLYNVEGQRVGQLLNNLLKAGSYEINFQLNDKPSGVYFIKLQFENKLSITKKLILIK